MQEAGLLIGLEGEVMYFHQPVRASAGSLPDSPDLWTVIWNNRDRIQGFAHSHPGGGVPGPSWTDITTFAAVETALGRRISWWIISKDLKTVECRYEGPGKHDYKTVAIASPDWYHKLYAISY